MIEYLNKKLHFGIKLNSNIIEPDYTYVYMSFDVVLMLGGRRIYFKNTSLVNVLSIEVDCGFITIETYLFGKAIE